MRYIYKMNNTGIELITYYNYNSKKLFLDFMKPYKEGFHFKILGTTK